MWPPVYLVTLPPITLRENFWLSKPVNPPDAALGLTVWSITCGVLAPAPPYVCFSRCWPPITLTSRLLAKTPSYRPTESTPPESSVPCHVLAGPLIVNAWPFAVVKIAPSRVVGSPITVPVIV